VCGGNKSGGNFLIPVIVVFTGGTTSFEHDASGEVGARGSQSVGSHSRLHGAEVALPLWKVSSQCHCDCQAAPVDTPLHSVRLRRDPATRITLVPLASLRGAAGGAPLA
jgi:hypothetical protein